MVTSFTGLTNFIKLVSNLMIRMGAYTVAGSLWENMMPFWKSASDQ